MDTIFIQNLLVRGIIGVNDWEREVKQDIIINVQLEIDLQAAGQSDDINDTVNYRTLSKEIIELVENSTYILVEKLAEEIASLCLQKVHVESVVVRVEKPTALRFAESVGVEINRIKSS